MMDISFKPYVRRFLESVKLSDIMTRDVVTIDLYAPFSEVERLMLLHDIRHLPVVASDGNLVGLITQRDLYRIAPPRIAEDGTRFYVKEYLDEFLLRHVMTKQPFAMKAGDSFASALIAMAEHRYGCLSIVDNDGKLCGILTLADLVRRAAKLITE